jgi:uncharacterized membrane protein YgdD (TMEM256/DUF423 family)
LKESASRWIVVSSLMGFLGVAIGAFGAHSLKQYLTPETTESFRTGVLYHLIHTSVLLAISLSARLDLMKANKFFLAGIILFSFSLYIYSLTSIKFIAMITPFGGVSFLLGWLMLMWQAWRELKIKN